VPKRVVVAELARRGLDDGEDIRKFVVSGHALQKMPVK
jgi:hypothetical protein